MLHYNSTGQAPMIDINVFLILCNQGSAHETDKSYAKPRRAMATQINLLPEEALFAGMVRIALRDACQHRDQRLRVEALRFLWTCAPSCWQWTCRNKSIRTTNVLSSVLSLLSGAQNHTRH